MKFIYDGKEYSREELEHAVFEEAKGLDPEQWFSGRFEFDEWLSDSLANGSVRKVDADL